MEKSLFDIHEIPISETYDLRDVFDEYLLILAPDNKLTAAINKIKLFFAKEFGCHLAAGLKPHITLATFLIFPTAEKSTIKFLSGFAKSVKPFEVLIKDFGKFEHVIFAAVKSQKPIKDISEAMKSRWSRRTRHSYFANNPHITIARGMTTEQQEKAWEEWGSKKLEASFEAKEMLLLKRNTRNRKSQLVATFPFEGRDILGAQLDLTF